MHAPTFFDTKVFSDSITRPSNTTAYAAEDVISEVTSDDHFTFATPIASDTAGLTTDDAVINPRSSTRSFVLNWVEVVLDAVPATNLGAVLLLLHTDIADVADNAALAITDAEVRNNLLTAISIVSTDWLTVGSSMYQRVVVNIPLVLPAAATGQLFGILKTTNAYTPASAGVILVRLGITRD